jgi:hypothetical protein
MSFMKEMPGIAQTGSLRRSRQVPKLRIFHTGILGLFNPDHSTPQLNPSLKKFHERNWMGDTSGTYV